MFKVLVSLDHPVSSDLVCTALAQFPDCSAHPVPPTRLFEVLGDDRNAAVFIDLERVREAPGTLARRVRAVDPTIEVLCLIPRDERELHNRLKLDLGVFSFVPSPIDAFDLAKRIQRLLEHLRAAGGIRSGC